MAELWRPACDIKHMHSRAQMLSTIRNFFQQRSVLEVETPLLCHATGTDPQLDFFSSSSTQDQQLFLQTSPEFAMKRLLAAGSGSIFQICKAFRKGESGRFHNPEFSILEWYRVEFSLHQLMDEVTELLIEILPKLSPIDVVKKISYVELFEQVTSLNPLQFCQKDYALYAKKNALSDAATLCGNDHSMWLDFIFSHKIQATLNNQQICLVFGYPAIQSSLARLNQENPNIADRFEVFINGIEIGNGFFELANAKEQEARFDNENSSRKSKGLVSVKKDQLFLDALKSGLPNCSGIAIGLDRLLMIMTNSKSLDDVLAFPFERA